MARYSLELCAESAVKRQPVNSQRNVVFLPTNVWYRSAAGDPWTDYIILLTDAVTVRV